MTYYSNPPRPDELYHHGIKGMKWGRRRWQNDDGSLTPAGEKHYYRKDGTLKRKGKKALLKTFDEQERRKAQLASRSHWDKAEKFARKHNLSDDDYVSADEVKEYLRERNGINSRTKQNVVEYSRLVDAAERNRDRIYADLDKKKLNYSNKLIEQMRLRDQYKEKRKKKPYRNPLIIRDLT